MIIAYYLKPKKIDDSLGSFELLKKTRQNDQLRTVILNSIAKSIIGENPECFISYNQGRNLPG